MAAAEESWEDFAAALAQVLAGLEERSYLLVAWSAVPTVEPHLEFPGLGIEDALVAAVLRTLEVSGIARIPPRWD